MQFSKNAGHLSHFAGRGTSDENAGLSLRMPDGGHLSALAIYLLSLRMGHFKSLVLSNVYWSLPGLWLQCVRVSVFMCDSLKMVKLGFTRCCLLSDQCQTRCQSLWTVCELLCQWAIIGIVTQPVKVDHPHPTSFHCWVRTWILRGAR